MLRILFFMGLVIRVFFFSQTLLASDNSDRDTLLLPDGDYRQETFSALLRCILDRNTFGPEPEKQFLDVMKFHQHLLLEGAYEMRDSTKLHHIKALLEATLSDKTLWPNLSMALSSFDEINVSAHKSGFHNVAVGDRKRFNAFFKKKIRIDLAVHITFAFYGVEKEAAERNWNPLSSDGSESITHALVQRLHAAVFRFYAGLIPEIFSLFKTGPSKPSWKERFQETAVSFVEEKGQEIGRDAKHVWGCVAPKLPFKLGSAINRCASYLSCSVDAAEARGRQLSIAIEQAKEHLSVSSEKEKSVKPKPVIPRIPKWHYGAPWEESFPGVFLLTDPRLMLIRELSSQDRLSTAFYLPRDLTVLISLLFAHLRAAEYFE